MKTRQVGKSLAGTIVICEACLFCRCLAIDVLLFSVFAGMCLVSSCITINISHNIVKHEGSLPCLQAPATGPSR